MSALDWGFQGNSWQSPSWGGTREPHGEQGHTGIIQSYRKSKGIVHTCSLSFAKKTLYYLNQVMRQSPFSDQKASSTLVKADRVSLKGKHLSMLPGGDTS